MFFGFLVFRDLEFGAWFSGWGVAGISKMSHHAKSRGSSGDGGLTQLELKDGYCINIPQT